MPKSSVGRACAGTRYLGTAFGELVLESIVRLLPLRLARTSFDRIVRCASTAPPSARFASASPVNAGLSHMARVYRSGAQASNLPPPCGEVGEPLARQRKGEPGGGSARNVAQHLTA